MKSIYRNGVRMLGALWFLNYRTLNMFRNFKIRLYSEIVKKSFKKCGHKFIIIPPATVVGPIYISIGENFNCFARLRIEAYDSHNGFKYQPQILIGDNVGINYDCHIACVNKVVIGNNVLIGSKVIITDHFHGNTSFEHLQMPPNQRPLVSKGEIIIEDNVWIGEGVAIMPGVTIGKNSVIGANSVVTKSFPSYSIIGGIPAKVIKHQEKVPS